MSNSLSPGSDLVIDDDDLEITMEDLSKAEAECFAGPSGGQVLARPTISAIPPTQPKQSTKPYSSLGPPAQI